MKLNPIFSDHMVFAAERPIRVYGEGDGAVCVEFAGQTAYAKSENGRWPDQFETMRCGGAYELSVRCAEETIVRKDIFVGEIYLCSGQSNMQMQLHETQFVPERYADEDILRFFATRRMSGEMVL